jgi:hypothetical protein
MNDDSLAKNTDKEIWRERPGDYYSDAILVTEHGSIGINCGGNVICRTAKQWHELAVAEILAANAPAIDCAELAKLRDELSEVIAQRGQGSFLLLPSAQKQRPSCIEPGAISGRKICEALGIDWKNQLINKLTIEVPCNGTAKIHVHIQRTPETEDVDKLAQAVADVPHEIIVDER